MTWKFPLNTKNWMWPDYAGTFGAKRKFNKHPGLDIYCDVGTEVVAVEDGVVVGIQYFTGKMLRSPWWNDTFCVAVKGKSGVVNYGEIDYNRELSVGDKVKRGDAIGTVLAVLKKDKGRPTSMLHFELYENFDSKHGWPADLEEPNDLRDPAPKLEDAALEEFGEIKYYKPNGKCKSCGYWGVINDICSYCNASRSSAELEQVPPKDKVVSSNLTETANERKQDG